MSKRLIVVPVILLLLVGSAIANVGIFTNTQDIGSPAAVGSTVDVGTSPIDGTGSDHYLQTGGGGDIWDQADHFQYAYRTVSGDVRITGSFEWVANGTNDWAKMGVMLRESTAVNSVQYSTFTRKWQDY